MVGVSTWMVGVITRRPIKTSPLPKTALGPDSVEWPGRARVLGTRPYGGGILCPRSLGLHALL